MASSPSNTIVLDRREITGPLTKNTPRCVVFQVAGCLRFEISDSKADSYVDRLISTLKGVKPINVLREKFTTNMAPYIARFVNGNPKIEWEYRSLNKAYTHLLKYYRTTDPEIPEGDFKVGDPTPEEPESYDACILYRICSHLRVRMDRDTTVEQMANVIRVHHQETSQIREHMISMISSLSRNKLLSLQSAPEFTLLPSPPIKSSVNMPLPTGGERSRRVVEFPNIEPGSVPTTVLNTTYGKLMNMEHVISRIEPVSHQEAIILAAVIYGVNLTDCSNPHTEYLELKKVAMINGRRNYIPVADKLFQKRYLANPTYYDVRRQWVASIPSIYTEDHINSFARSEGWNGDDESEPAEYLAMSRVVATFHLGIHPKIFTPEKTEMKDDDLRTTISLENPIDYGSDRIISYGIDVGGEFQIFTVDDLTSFFSSYKKFANPSKPDEMLSDQSIEKLKNICREFVPSIDDEALPMPEDNRGWRYNNHNIRSNEDKKHSRIDVDESVIEEYRALYDIICKVERLSIPIGKDAQRLREMYSENKEDIGTYCRLFMEIGLYMRGWKIDKTNGESADKYPLESADTLVTEQGMIMLNTSKAITDFEKHLQSQNSELAHALLALPLMRRYFSGSTNAPVFSANTDPEQGLTIMDRLAIVKDDTNGYACIRMTSNHFLTSAFFYMVIVLQQDEPFDLNAVSDIA